MRKTLTEDQIQRINAHLSSQSIPYWDVKAEILDHLICATEDKMYNENLDFDIAFRKVEKDFLDTFDCTYYEEVVRRMKLKLFRAYKKRIFLSLIPKLRKPQVILFFIMTILVHEIFLKFFSISDLSKLSILFILLLYLTRLGWQSMHRKIFFKSAAGTALLQGLSISCVNLIVFIPKIFTDKTLYELVPVQVIICLYSFIYLFMYAEFKLSLHLWNKLKHLKLQIH